MKLIRNDSFRFIWHIWYVLCKMWDADGVLSAEIFSIWQNCRFSRFHFGINYHLYRQTDNNHILQIIWSRLFWSMLYRGPCIPDHFLMIHKLWLIAFHKDFERFHLANRFELGLTSVYSAVGILLNIYSRVSQACSYRERLEVSTDR